MKIVKQIMVVRDTLGYVLRAKTGWIEQDGKQIGWYVGYLERQGNVYIFSNCIQSSDASIPGFLRARVEITDSIMAALGLVPGA